MTAPLGAMIALLMVVFGMAVLGAPRPEADPQRILSDGFAISKAGVAAALREHMSEQLKARNLRPATYHLEVEFAPRLDGNIDIALTWTVYEKGKLLGAIRQENVLPYWVDAEGSGTWRAAATAGAEGFAKLLGDEDAK
jgi:hypothetical protein